MANIVCDTNVFYDIAEGTVDAKKLSNGGANKLWASPITVLEIISKVNEQEFTKRQNAAQAVVKNAGFLANPEYELCDAWDVLDTSSICTKCDNFMKILAEATDFPTFCNDLAAEGENYGPINMHVLGLENGSAREINLEFFRDFRAMHERDFRTTMVSVVDDMFPGYGEKVQAGTLNLKKSEKTSRLDDLKDSVFTKTVLYMTRRRAGISDYCDTSKYQRHPSQSTTQGAELRLQFYLKGYESFVEDIIACNKGVHDNDLGDLEYFIHVRPGWSLATSEDTWICRAKRNGYYDQIKEPKTV